MYWFIFILLSIIFFIGIYIIYKKHIFKGYHCISILLFLFQFLALCGREEPGFAELIYRQTLPKSTQIIGDVSEYFGFFILSFISLIIIYASVISYFKKKK